MLLDELLASAVLKAEDEPVCCNICFSIPESVEDVHLFRECRHSFCKYCIKQFVEVHLRENQIEKLICPAVNGTKPCSTRITEVDLRKVGTDEELVQRIAIISISKAIDQSNEFSWCPEPKC